jgi:addiction module HigA family antidote
MSKHKRTRKPTTPGEILHEEFLVPLGLTQKELADHICVDVKVINRIVNEKTSISSIVAVKLAYTFGMSANFWLNAQMALDIYNAEQSLTDIPERIACNKTA